MIKWREIALTLKLQHTASAVGLPHFSMFDRIAAFSFARMHHVGTPAANDTAVWVVSVVPLVAQPWGPLVLQAPVPPVHYSKMADSTDVTIALHELHLSMYKKA
jgi:hypothetical protein